jgi:hypothetical protein
MVLDMRTPQDVLGDSMHLVQKKHPPENVYLAGCRVILNAAGMVCCWGLIVSVSSRADKSNTSCLPIYFLL